jgi:hypothetical protein
MFHQALVQSKTLSEEDYQKWLESLNEEDFKRLQNEAIAMTKDMLQESAEIDAVNRAEGKQSYRLKMFKARLKDALKKPKQSKSLKLINGEIVLRKVSKSDGEPKIDPKNTPPRQARPTSHFDGDPPKKAE